MSEINSSGVESPCRKHTDKFEKKLYEGNVLKKLFVFSLPFLLSNIIQSLYSVIDMIIVGNFSGSIAMSGVYIGGQISFILTYLVIGFCTGATVLVSQYMAAGKREQMKKVIAMLFTVLLIAAAAVTVLMIVFRNELLTMIKTPPESFGQASSFLICSAYGTVFIFGYNALSAVMRALGDSKRPFYFVLIACVTNIVLDLVFVAGYGMGAFGAALATVISQALSMMFCIGFMIKNKFVFDFKPSSFKIYKEELRLTIKLGLPMMIQNGVYGVAFLFLTVIANTLGASATAAVGAVSRVMQFATMPGMAMSMSVGTMCAQSIGVGKWDRAIKSVKIGIVMAEVFSVITFVLVWAFPEAILRVFADDPSMIEEGVVYMKTFSFDFFLYPIIFCINGIFLGAGNSMFTMLISILSSLLFRMPVAYIFGIALNMGILGIGLASPIASASSLIIQFIYLLTGRWRVNKAAKSIAVANSR